MVIRGGWSGLVVVVVVTLAALFHCPPTLDVVGVDVIEWGAQLEDWRGREGGQCFEEVNLKRMGEGRLLGPESMVVDPEDPFAFFAGTADGKVVYVSEKNDSVALLAHVGGRPLGLHALASTSKPSLFGEARILVAEALQGLLAIDRDGSVRILANQAEGSPIRYANDLDVDEEEGLVYFSDSSAIPPLWDKGTRLWSTMKAAQFDILSGHPSGRLLRYDARTKAVTVLLNGIAYANGVALAEDRSFVLVAETGRYAIRRLWLSGPRGTVLLTCWKAR